MAVTPLIQAAPDIVETALRLEEQGRSDDALLVLEEGYGADRLPRVGQIDDSPQFGLPQVGDAVLTTGGQRDLYPPDLPIGFVANVIRRPGAEGIVVEVEPSADLTRLEFLTVILYQPATELR